MGLVTVRAVTSTVMATSKWLVSEYTVRGPPRSYFVEHGIVNHDRYMSEIPANQPVVRKDSARLRRTTLSLGTLVGGRLASCPVYYTQVLVFGFTYLRGCL